MNALQAVLIFSRVTLKQAKAYVDKVAPTKVKDAVDGHVAVLDAEGNLKDGGVAPLTATVQQTTLQLK